MPRPEKTQEVELLAQKIKASKSIFVTEYRGLSVADISSLRRKLREAGTEYKVVHNRLAKIALTNAKLDFMNEFFRGPVAVAFTTLDPAKTAKTLMEFNKAHEKLIIKAGMMDNQLMSSDQVKFLATLPPREVLIGKLVSTISSPLYGFLRVLQGPAYGLVNVLDQIKKQKESAGQPA